MSMLAPSTKMYMVSAVAICLLALLAGLLFWNAPEQQAEVKTETVVTSQKSLPITAVRTEISGTISAIDADNKLLVLDLPSGEQKKVEVRSETKIVRIVRQNDLSATTQEYNISDVRIGSNAQVRYGIEVGDALRYVDQVYLGEIQFADLERESKPKVLFANKIVSFDAYIKNLLYRGISFVTKEEFEQSIILSSDTKIYTAPNGRANIEHARIEGTLVDLLPGKNVYMLYAPQTSGTIGKPHTLIVTD